MATPATGGEGVVSGVALNRDNNSFPDEEQARRARARLSPQALAAEKATATETDAEEPTVVVKPTKPRSRRS